MSPRKQTHIADREAEILRIAGELIKAEGLHALTMENVLARVSFSKGTLYNHFSCREDLLVAFHARCFAEHLEYFERGALFRGRPRERYMAAGQGHEVKLLLDPQPFRLALNEEILAAASERWRDAFVVTHRETMGVFLGIVRDAMASGDLPATHPPELIAAASWAIGTGVEELRDAGLVFRGLPRQEFSQKRRLMYYALLDGFEWQPLSRDHDYEAVRLRVLNEIYAPEARELGLLPATPANVPVVSR